MNMFAKNAAKSLEEYLLMIPDDRKKDIDFLNGKSLRDLFYGKKGDENLPVSEIMDNVKAMRL